MPELEDGGLVVRPGDQGQVLLPYLAEVVMADGRSEVVRASAVTPDASGTTIASGSSATFSGRLRLEALVGPPARCHGLLTLSANRTVSAGVRVECRLGPSPEPGWLVPGLFYGENRQADGQRAYPRFSTDHPDHALLESDYWAFRADRAATPAVFAWDQAGGAALVTTETSVLGQSGLGFATEPGATVLRLHFPFREQPVSYDGSAAPRPPVVATASFPAGQVVELRFTLYLLGPDRHGYAPVLRHIYDEGPAGPQRVAWVGIEEAAELAAWGLHRWHYRASPPVLLETAAFDREALGSRGDRTAMHVSWVSGAPYAYALLRHARRCGETSYAEAAVAVLDHITANLAPGGTFWGQWQEGRGWGIGWTPETDRLHARTLADATLFVLRALVLEWGHGGAHEEWERAVSSNLAVAAAHQRGDGALGAAYSANDGGVLDWRGSAGLAWVAPLAEAGRALSKPAWVVAAARAGEFYAASVEREYLCGAPEDVDLAPTSEDGYLAVMSYMALYRADGDPVWLSLAQRSADWMLTFRYSYDVLFSPHTLLGHYGFRTRGADQASPSNQHLHAFGLICLPEIAELSAALGDDYYFRRQRETLACFRQFIAREDGDFDAYRGMASERYYQTTCFQAKGMLLTLSHAWSVGVLLLACEEAIASGLSWEEDLSPAPAAGADGPGPP